MYSKWLVLFLKQLGPLPYYNNYIKISLVAKNSITVCLEEKHRIVYSPTSKKGVFYPTWRSFVGRLSIFVHIKKPDVSAEAAYFTSDKTSHGGFLLCNLLTFDGFLLLLLQKKNSSCIPCVRNLLRISFW